MKNLLLTLSFSALMIGCNSKDKSTQATIKEIASQPVKIEFPSVDNVMITANLYEVGSSAPVIILCHQARSNKSEYNDIAITLMKQGFNCLAIDQRSGGNANESINETKVAAEQLNLPTEFLDAEQDIIAAIDYSFKRFGKKVILWGSSYSAALALHIAPENEKIETVIAFSPGDYFGNGKETLKTKLQGFMKPMFITSAKGEAPSISSMLDKSKMGTDQIQFTPNANGSHGSSALWKTTEGNVEYWDAINNFLGSR